MQSTFIKKILLGVTGGIAAYKSVELVRLLRKNNIEVKVVMTKTAMQFVQPLTFATLSNNQVYTEMFDQTLQFDCEHIELAKWADAILIAPATANIVAKLAHGIADDLLSTICLAAENPIYIAPAMNQAMWKNAITQKNIEDLKSRGVRCFGPTQGEQACGDIGFGRMLEPQAILDAILNSSKKLLLGKNVLITAGPTIEPIDPVRFISNHSSGKMGYAVAEAAIDHGAKVTLISGPTAFQPPSGCQFFSVRTAQEMYDGVMRNITGCDIFIGVAAVADYRVAEFSEKKVKRGRNTSLTLQLVKNPDILADVAKLAAPPFTVGFAAETENLEKQVRTKLQHKNVDVVVGNLVGKNQGFDSDENQLLVIAKNGEKVCFTKKSKTMLAYELIGIVARECNAESTIKTQQVSPKGEI